VAAMTHSAVMDEWQLDDDRRMIVALINHEGRWRVDARIWFRAEDGSFTPGRGLALSVRHLERLTRAIEKTRRGAVGRFLITLAQSSGTDGT
jgi:hypothetical protein